MPNIAPLQEIARFYRRLQWTAVALLAGWLLWLLAPVLSPFVFAALLGWLGDPLVDRIERRGLSRNAAVLLVFGGMMLVLVLALLLLLPLLERQIVTLVQSLPRYRDWLVGTVGPWLERRTGLQLLAWLDPERLIELVRSHWQQAGGMARTVLGYLSRSGFALLGVVANVVLLPVLTFFFLMIILGSTDPRAPKGLAPIAIGLGLTLIHLIGIPVTNLSVNPARSTGPAVFVGSWAISQLWLFWVAPIIGAALAGIVYPHVAGKPSEQAA